MLQEAHVRDWKNALCAKTQIPTSETSMTSMTSKMS